MIQDKMTKVLSLVTAVGLLFSGGCDWMQKQQDNDKKAAKPTENIVEVAKRTGTFTTLVKALQAAGLADTLATGGPYTVFAPTDAAFAQLPPGELDNLMRPDNRMKLQTILKYHVVDGKVTSSELKEDKSLMTLEGKPLKIKVQNGKIYVDGAMVEGAQVEASNGVIHVINKVLIPPKS